MNAGRRTSALFVSSITMRMGWAFESRPDHRTGLWSTLHRNRRLVRAHFGRGLAEDGGLQGGDHAAFLARGGLPSRNFSAIRSRLLASTAAPTNTSKRERPWA